MKLTKSSIKVERVCECAYVILTKSSIRVENMCECVCCPKFNVLATCGLWLSLGPELGIYCLG